MTVLGRNLDYPPETPVAELGPAAIDDLLDRGDLDSWKALARAVRKDPFGEVAETVVRLCTAHPMYGTSRLWTDWIHRLRRRGLRGLRRSRGLTQAEVARRLGISQSDVSKLERRADMRLSTLKAYVEATGGRLSVKALYPGDDIEL